MAVSPIAFFIDHRLPEQCIYFLNKGFTDAGGKMDKDFAHNDIPALLTQDEAVKILRLDSLGLRVPKESLRHLRRTGQLAYVKVAGKILIPKKEIATYLEHQAHNSQV